MAALFTLVGPATQARPCYPRAMRVIGRLTADARAQHPRRRPVFDLREIRKALRDKGAGRVSDAVIVATVEYCGARVG